MRLAAAELIQGPSTPRGQSASGATLDKVTAWLDEQRKDKVSVITAADPAATPLSAQSRHDALWHSVTLLGAPLLWPATMEALWLGEPVWQHLQKRGQWFQVVEVILWDAANDQVLAKAERTWRRVATTESALENLLSVPMTGDGKAEMSAHTAPDEHVIVLVGTQSRLAVRVFGYPPPELREALQDICFEADEALEEPVAKPQGRRDLAQSLVQKALIRSGPRAAPWNGKTAARALIVLSLVTAGLVAWVVKQEVNWEQAIAQLDAEPGLKVTASTLRWGIREVEGLRDVNAEDPAVVLRRQGHTLEQVELKMDTVVFHESTTADKP